MHDNTWRWLFMASQSMHNHDLIRYQVFSNIEFKENICCKTKLPASQDVVTLHRTPELDLGSPAIFLPCNHCMLPIEHDFFVLEKVS